jgi:hypothetical protein
MTRPLHEFESKMTPESGSSTLSATLEQSGRAFAAALSALMVAALVVGRTEAALRPADASSEASITAGVVSISDDDRGSALFDLENLTPSEEASRCVTVLYDGTALPAELTFTADASGELASFIDVVVTSGTAGGFDDCSTFVPTRVVYNGALNSLAGSDPVAVAEFFNTGEQVTFRIQLTLADEAAAMGRSTSVTFAWEATAT